MAITVAIMLWLFYGVYDIPIIFQGAISLKLQSCNKNTLGKVTWQQTKIAIVNRSNKYIFEIGTVSSHVRPFRELYILSQRAH